MVERKVAPSHLAELAARVRDALASACGAPAGTRLHLAVSGGADSVALVSLIAELGDWPIGAVVFVDHGLREIDAERESARAAASRVGVPFRELAVKVGREGNLQALARAARYRALIALAEADGALVATGHTATDQAETVLGRMLRGAGVSGLAGLRPRLGRVIRPLLGVSRQETRSLGLPFVDDPTNTAPRFARNRIRHALLPALERENPRVVEALGALASAAQGTRALVAALVGALERAGGLSGLALTPEATTALLHHLASEAGVSPTRRALEQWGAAMGAKRPTRVALGDGLSGVVDEHGAPRVEARADPRQAVSIAGPGEVGCAGVTLTVSEGPHPGARLVTGPLPWRLMPLPGAQAAQRGLTDLDAPVATLEDATGRTLGRVAPGGRWVEGTRGRRSPPDEAGRVAGICFYVSFDTSAASTQSEVVAPPAGPLTSDDPSLAASNHPDGIQGLPNQGRAPTETKSASRIPRSGRLS